MSSAICCTPPTNRPPILRLLQQRHHATANVAHLGIVQDALKPISHLDRRLRSLIANTINTPLSEAFGPTFHLSSSSVVNSSIACPSSDLTVTTSTSHAPLIHLAAQLIDLCLESGSITPAKSLTYPVGCGSFASCSARAVLCARSKLKTPPIAETTHNSPARIMLLLFTPSSYAASHPEVPTPKPKPKGGSLLHIAAAPLLLTYQNHILSRLA